ncbi:alpha/beta fold hydrolase [Nocardiopsis potens]|uniref:alpha/beta fold hydrolase n=1 Tax=Nocardiopsis potens TaxID=1246458 RepID=UPI000349282C|nr:alpha/beta hydrolase [Nocardiopsis potens]
MTPAGAFTDPTDLRLSGGPLRVYRAGPPGAPPVLLLHGAMLDSAPLIWHSLLPHLARDRDVIAVDMPRHGGSRPWSGRLDQAALESVVDELLDLLGIERTALVGLSMGGSVAAGYAASRPERVTALAAIGAGGLEEVRPAQFPTWCLLQWEWPLRRATGLLARPSVLHRAMRAHLVRGAQTPGYPWMMARIEEEGRLRAAHRELVLDDFQIHAYGPRRMRTFLVPELHRLRAPSLWLHGVHDKAVDGRAVRRAASAAPGGRYADIERAGHLAPLDEPDRVDELIGGFLAEAVPAGA